MNESLEKRFKLKPINHQDVAIKYYMIPFSSAFFIRSLKSFFGMFGFFSPHCNESFPSLKRALRVLIQIPANCNF